ncbi:MAG: drug/metabolite transporter (DMT)-like permease [Gammaproteobacteria bacterium]|jgi:drug/metabolite transporter (DMT)-like permease
MVLNRKNNMNKMAIMMAIISAMLFGAATPLSKLLLEGFSPFQLAGLLYLGAALAVAPFALKNGGLALPQRSDRRNQIRLFGAVLFGGILGPVALLLGLRLANAASVSLWLNLELAATAVLGVVLFKDHLGLRGWFGVAAAMLASVLLVWSPGSAGYLSVFLVLIACLCWGLDNHLTALIDGITPSQSTLWKGVVAGTVNLVIGVSLAPITVGLYYIALALLVGSLAYGASIVLYIRSAQSIGATRAQVLFASAPLFGVLLSVIILGEPLSPVHAIAIPIFLLGVALLMFESHTHVHVHEAQAHEHLHSHDDGHHFHQHPGLPSSTKHTHAHMHEPIEHQHPHWPDIHHRHLHKSE